MRESIISRVQRRTLSKDFTLVNLNRLEATWWKPGVWLALPVGEDVTPEQLTEKLATHKPKELHL